MRAIFLAAGLGSRLGLLTQTTPKCLMPINGRPLMDIWLDQLFSSGIERALINTHYLHDLVVQYVETSKYRKFLDLVYEPVLLGTAGTLIKNINFFKQQDGILMHGDNYTNADFNLLTAAHALRPTHCLLTMAVFRAKDPSSCGMVEIDTHGVAIGYEEKPTSSRQIWANGAIFILSTEAIKIIKRDYWFANDFCREILPNFVGKIYTHPIEDIFIDVGTPSSYGEACRHAKNLTK